MDPMSDFNWQRHAAAENLCLDALAVFRRESAALARMEERIAGQTSGRLLDWVDHLLLRPSAALRDDLSRCGFVRQEGTDRDAWLHPGAQLPRILLSASEGVALRVERIADFLQAHDFVAEIEGEPFAPYRRALAASQGGIALFAVERRGSRGYDPQAPPQGALHDYLAGVELWQTRPRGEGEDAAMAEALRRAEGLVTRLGSGTAAHIVCLGERCYWLARNAAGRVQKGRQDALGLGWGNHDHHTFRSSRRNFPRLVELFSLLGFHHRERFYAGDEAGWGAQLMENPEAGLTLFLDVDLAPGEIASDFSREALPERDELGTVGLWCALHGDSILGGGMHHLAAQFDFDRLIGDLARHGVSYMAPFSNFPYLKQAFSVAERRDVPAQRLAKLVSEKIISPEQEERFAAQGAIASHLENIERREGYKGFNQKNVSHIIRKTDPRTQGPDG